MERHKLKALGFAASHLAMFMLGAVFVYLAWLPVGYVWGIFFGVETHSEASFPMGHIARLYSAPGLGDQQLICTVDGWTVYRTGDWEPGNVNEKIEWDQTGTIVKFIASGRTIYIYDTNSRSGRKG